MSSSNPNDSNTSAARLNWPVDSHRMSGDFWLAFHTEVHGAVTELGLTMPASLRASSGSGTADRSHSCSSRSTARAFRLLSGIRSSQATSER